MPIDPRRIVAFLQSEAGRPLRAKEIAAALHVDPADFAAFRDTLDRLEDEGALYRLQRQRYAVPQRINLQVGRIQTTRAGAGFLISDDGGPDIFIPKQSLNTAVDGDRVAVRLERQQGGARPEGSVVRVVERARTTVVGAFHPMTARLGKRGAHGFVVPQDSKLPWDVFVAADRIGAAQDGDLVVVRITDWGNEHRGPAGVVEEILGQLGNAGMDVLAILRAHGLPVAFPPDVESAADALRQRGISPAELRDREDLRNLLVFTIDPVDAKDHDDAVSIETVSDGWRVGVHIADVAHYVRENDIIDAEALRRGTSVYLVDRVVPMLPHALSSDICSLVPQQDRLTLSLFIDIASDGTTRGHRLVRGMIRSRHKLAYEQAQAVLDGSASIDEATDAALRMLRDVARLLRTARHARGSIDFDLPEARIVLNAEGEPTDIQRIVRLEAHRLIEDFMLLANEVIARKAVQKDSPFIYRVHEPPDEARMDQLRQFLAGLGHRLAGQRGPPSPRDLQGVLAAAHGRPDEALLSTVVLRSMKQARYSEQNLGHFGLALRAYTHFTSPIRRYPDLIVHRVAAALFIDQRDAWLDGDQLADIARNASERERVAVTAERDSKDLKKVEFMERHIGDAFAGTISGVTAFGFFVLLDDFFIDGLVHVSSLEDDYYRFVEEQYVLVGERSQRRFRVGDRVRVQVASVNKEERQIDFVVVQDSGGSERREGRNRL